MINWRAPLIHLWDTQFKHTHIHEQIALQRRYFQQPIQEQLQFQHDQLIALLAHAALHVPYYRTILSETGVFADGKIDLARFTRIPPLTRDTLNSSGQDLYSNDRDQRRSMPNSSGGSTGQPVRFLVDSHYMDCAIATTQLQYEWCGATLGQRRMKLWGSDRDITEGSRGTKAQLISALRNVTYLNCFRMTPDMMQDYVKTINRLKPNLIEAYVDGVYELARFINANHLHVVTPRSIIASAGTLRPFMREEIQRAFGCDVYDRYGSREVGNMAIERTQETGLHVTLCTVLIEVIDDSGAPCVEGQEGSILVTSLTNYAMPFIRYSIGDRAIVGQSTAYPVASVVTLAQITGREGDTFIRRDGTVISPLFFVHFLGVVHNKGWVRKAQVIQEDYERVVVKIVTYKEPDPQVLEEIMTNIRLVMGDTCEVKFDFVDNIPPLPSGKFRYTISNVPRSSPTHPIP